MKRIMIFSIVVSALAFTTTRDKLIGRWQTKPSVNGNVTGIVIKADSSFEGFVNKKPFTSGHYTVADSLFSFVDNGCDGKRAVYKLIFFSNDDSLRFEPVTDSCVERKRGMSQLVMGRIR
ncbi:MAG TPA: hypothetical protein VK644_14760 [Chitinophagaceae bacterium]|nr:hypothetical protein [Chitinophagaceae bacterium]